MKSFPAHLPCLLKPGSGTGGGGQCEHPASRQAPDLRHLEPPTSFCKLSKTLYEKMDGAQFAPVRVRKKGTARVKQLWPTQLGTGEGGPVEYIGVPAVTGMMTCDDDEDEELSTEVLVLKGYQAWVPKEG